MLEQSALHGRIYCSSWAGKTIVSKPVPVDAISFGPMRPIQLYRVSDNEMWVQDKNAGDWYHYAGPYAGVSLPLEGQYKENEIQIAEHVSGSGFFYYYGKAFHNRKNEKNPGESEHLYFVQNQPTPSHTEIPDTGSMEMPFTVQALDYPQKFHYPQAVKALLRGLPACYADRVKRPIRRMHGRTYPVPMEKVSTTWDDLPEATYPVVLDFSKSTFGIADLEPEHTPEDLAHFDSLPGFYEEETPRGGRHKLVRIEDGAFKARHSKGLEIINQSQVTLYGINARWLHDSPAAVDLSVYQAVGHEKHEITARLERPDVQGEIALLRRKAEENLSCAKTVAANLYLADSDTSHGEFVALLTLYNQDIAPYAAQFDENLLPWILEGYAEGIIQPREKHETMRQGLPFLVYLAAIITEKKAVHIWK